MNHLQNNGETRLIGKEDSHQGIYQISPQGHLIFANSALAQIFGYESSEEIVRSIINASKQLFVDPMKYKQFLKEIKAHGVIENFETRNYRKDGSIIWTRTNANAVQDKDNHLLYIEGFITDITPYKQAEFSLLAEEKLYKALVEYLPAIVFLDTTEGLENTLYVSPKIKDLLGYTPDEWIRDPHIWVNSIHPDDRERVLAEDKRTRELNAPFQMEYRLKRKDGAYIWLREESSVIRDANNTPVFWQGFLLDISEQKQAEEIIQKSEALFATVFYASPVASSITTLEDGIFIDANRAYWDLSGFQPEEVIGKSGVILGFITQKQRQAFVKKLKKEKAIKGVEGCFITKDGKTLNTLEYYEIIRFGEKDHILCTFHDITGRLTALRALQESEERYRVLVEASPEAIIVHVDGTIVFANPTALHMIGATRPEQLLGQSVFDLLHPAYRDPATRRVKSASKTDKPLPVIEVKIIRKDGSMLDVEISSQTIQYGGKRAMQVFARDITEQKKAQEALRESEASYRGLFDSVQEAIYIQDTNGRFLDVNEGAVKMYGRPREFFLDKSPKVLSAPGMNNLKEVQKAVERAFRGEMQQFEFWGVRANGEVFPKEVRLYKGVYFGKDVVFSLAQDITDRKQAEEALRKSEEMLRSIVDHTTNIFYSHTADNRITYISAQMKSILGYETEEALINWHEFLTDHPVNQKGIELTQKAINTGKAQKPYILQLKAKDGSLVWVEVRESPLVRDGKTTAIVGALTDITERVQAEEILRRQLEELTILHQVATAASSSQSVDELIERVTSIIGDSLYTDNCGIELVTEQGDAFIPHPSYRGASTDGVRRQMPITKGVTGKVIKSGQAIRLGDVTQEPAYLEATPGVQSELCVPIKVGRKVIGVINVESKTCDAYTIADERLLITIAGNLATAIEKLHLLESEQKSRQEAERLREATAALTTSLELRKLFDAILENLGVIIPYDSASINLMEKQDLVIVAERNLPKGDDWIGKRYAGEEKWLEIFSSHKPLIMADAQTDPRFEKWEGTEYIHGWMGVPLISQGKVIGLLNLDSREINTFNENDAVIAQTFANSAAVAIENARLFEAEQKRRQEAETLQKATAVVTTALDQETAIELILEQLSRVVTFDSASVQLLRDGYMEIVGGRGSLVLSQEKDRHFPVPGNNPNTVVIQQRKPLLLKNAPEAYPGFLEMPSIQSWLGVPLIVHDDPIGILTLDSSEMDHFTEEQAQLVSAFANQAAIAIENARLFETEQKRRREAEILRMASASLTSSLEVKEVLDTLLQQIAVLVPYNSAAVFIQEQDQYRVVAGNGFRRPEKVIGQAFSLDDELASTVRETRQPIISRDIQQDVRFHNWGESENVHGWMCLPLIVRDQVIGHLTIDSFEIGAYDNSDAELATAFANQAAMALENARLFEAERQRHREAETLRQAAVAITTTLDLESVLEAILRVMKQVVPFDSASVLLLEDHHLSLTATQGFQNTIELLNLRFPANDELFQVVKSHQEPLILKDAQADPRFKKWAGTDYVRGWMGIPLIVRNEAIGYITLDNRQPDAYNPALANLAQSFANQAAVAIQNARQFEAEQRHFKEAESLRITAESITSSLDIRQVLNAVLDNLSTVISYDSATVFLLEGEHVRLTAARGLAGNEAVISMTFPASNALLKEIWKTRQPLILEDAEYDLRFEKWATVDNVHGWMGIPLISRGEIIGYITIDSHKVRAYDTHAARLAMTFAHQAAAAIENARLFERSEKQIRQLTVLRDIDTAISASFDLKVTLNVLLTHTLRELRADAALIFLYTASIQALSFYTSAGFGLNYDLPKTPIRLGSGSVGQVALQRKPIHIPDLPSQPEYKRSHLYNEEFVEYFGIPLVSKGQIQGVLELYMRKRITPSPDWFTFLETLAGQAAIAIDNAELFKNLQRSNQELMLAYDTTLEGWGKALELRDKETQGHTQRVVKMTIALARRLGIEGEPLTHIMRGTLLHDIGKMGIPDQILHKPGPLTEDEWVVMRQHPKYAYDLLSPIPYLRPALDIPYCHHERWNGSGYPRGLQGEEIPLAARIFAVVDIWDALLNERPYREAWSWERVIQYIRSLAGTELDAKIVEIFLQMLDEKAT